jgi:hypothetical protein
LSKAFTISVDMAGENKAAWTKDTNSAAMARSQRRLWLQECAMALENENIIVSNGDIDGGSEFKYYTSSSIAELDDG